MGNESLAKDPGLCSKCGWPLQSCECFGICGEPTGDCAKSLNGDTSEPLGSSGFSAETLAMLEDAEHEDYFGE